MLNTANTGKHSYPNIEVIKRVIKSPNKVAYSTSTHCSYRVELTCFIGYMSPRTLSGIMLGAGVNKGTPCEETWG